MSVFLIGLVFSFSTSCWLCIYSYRFQKSAKKIKIPSAFLFLNMPQKKIKDKLNFPPRLLLELVFIALMFISIYELTTSHNEEKELIILNNSQSMSAKLDDTMSGGGKTRFDKAVEMILENGSNSKKYRLITIPQATISNTDHSKYEDFSALKSRLKDIKVSSLQDTLPVEFSSLITESNANFVQIYTDKIINLEANESQKQKIISHQIGETKTNTYIDSFVSTDTPDGKYKFEAQIGFSGLGSTKTVVEFIEMNSGTWQPIETLFKTEVTIENDKLVTVPFEINKEKKNSSYKINLKKILQFDSIESDNEAFWIKDEALASTNQIIYLISDYQNLETIKDSIKSATLTNVEIISEDGALLKDFPKNSLLIYYKSRCPETIKAPSLVILPNAESKNLKISSIAKRISLTSWDKLSPLTKYISFDTLSIPQAMVFKDNNWGSGVIFNQQGAILVSGILNSNKIIVAGFELLPFDLERKSASDILLLNILSELKSVNEEVKLNQIYSNNYDSVTCISKSYNCETKLKFLEKGIYQVKKNDQIKNLAVNNLSSAESRTNHTFSINLKTPKDSLVDSTFDPDKKLPWSLWLALGVLLLDLILLNINGRELEWKGSSK